MAGTECPRHRLVPHLLGMRGSMDRAASLSMSLAATPSRSRGAISPELCFPPPSDRRGRREGRVPAGTRGPLRERQRGKNRTAATGVADHSAFPARWLDGLCRDLPGGDHSLASLAPRIDDAVCPVGLARTLRKLDRGNDGQDHTVLPYARPAMSPQYSQPCRRAENLRARRSLTAPSSARGFGLTGLPALPAPLVPTLPRPPQPGSRT